MKAAKRKKGNRRGPLRTTGPGQLIGMRVQPPLLKRIDAWAKSQDDKPTRQEAMRRLIERGLSSVPSAAPKASAETTVKASRLAAQTIDALGDASAPSDERESRKRRLLKGPSEFREMRADLPKAKR